MQECGGRARGREGGRAGGRTCRMVSELLMASPLRSGGNWEVKLLNSRRVGPISTWGREGGTEGG